MGPSILASTGNLNNKLPVKTYLTGRRFNDILAPNARNAAFNKGPIILSNTIRVLDQLSRRFLGSIHRGNRCVEGGISSFGSISRIHNVNLVVNVSLGGRGTTSITTHYIRGKLLVLATGRSLHVLPPLAVACSRVSEKLRVLRGALSRWAPVQFFAPYATATKTA